MDLSRNQRALVFIDGPNLYHGLKNIGLAPRYLDPARIARKGVEDRPLVQIRYYRVRIDASAPRRVIDAYDALTSTISADPKVVIVEGYLQRLRQKNPCASELLECLANLPDRLPPATYRMLFDLGQRHREVTEFREKGVDVQLAVDLVRLAIDDRYDLAYLVTGDGDFAPAVDAVRRIGKRVFILHPNASTRLRDAADLSIRTGRRWFDGCEIEGD